MSLFLVADSLSFLFSSHFDWLISSRRRHPLPCLRFGLWFCLRDVELSIPEIVEENNETTNEVYRLLKKYNNIRNTVRELKVSYMDAKLYPFLPRYIMLKDMVKGVLRHPSYMEVCQEDFINQSAANTT